MLTCWTLLATAACQFDEQDKQHYLVSTAAAHMTEEDKINAAGNTVAEVPA